MEKPVRCDCCGEDVIATNATYDAINDMWICDKCQWKAEVQAAQSAGVL